MEYDCMLYGWIHERANPVFLFTRAKKTGLSTIWYYFLPLLFISFDSLPASISQAICEQSMFVRFIYNL